MRLLKNKRGNWVDVIQYMGTAFAIGVLVFFMAWFLISFNDNLITISNNTTLIPAESLAVSAKAAADFPPAYDYILPMIYIFFVVFSVWSAKKISSSHLLAWLYPIIVLILLFISLVTESAWDQFVIDSTFDNIRTIFNKTNFFMSYLRYFVLVYSSLVGWALYAKDE